MADEEEGRPLLAFFPSLDSWQASGAVSVGSGEYTHRPQGRCAMSFWYACKAMELCGFGHIEDTTVLNSNENKLNVHRSLEFCDG